MAQKAKENIAITLVVAGFVIQTVGIESKKNLEGLFFPHTKHYSAHLNRKTTLDTTEHFTLGNISWLLGNQL